MGRMQDAEQRRIRRREWKRQQFSACGRCDYCNAAMLRASNATVDHIKPVSKGGSDQPYNWAIACFDCNQKKGNKELWEAGLILQRRRSLIQGDITKYNVGHKQQVQAHGNPDYTHAKFRQRRDRQERQRLNARIDRRDRREGTG